MVGVWKNPTADTQAYRADLGRNYNSDEPISIQNAKSLTSDRVYKSYVKLPSVADTYID